MTTRALQLDILLSGLRDPDTGAPLAGGTVEFYEAGTTNTKDVWSEKDKTNAYTSITLDSNGSVANPYYGDGWYKIIVKDADDNTEYTWDQVYLQSTVFSVVQKTGTYTATKDDDIILCDGTFTVNLSDVDTFSHPLTIKNIGSGIITVDPYSTQTIDGSAQFIIYSTNFALILYPDTSSSIWRRGYGEVISSRDQLTDLADEDKFLVEDASVVSGNNEKYVEWSDIVSEAFLDTQAHTNVFYLSNYANLAAAITAIDTAKARLVVDASETISADTVVPSNINLEFVNGYYFTVANTKTLTINGQVISGPYQAFLLSGTGKAALSGANNLVYPQWWGAAGTGSTDDVQYWEAAVNCNALTLIIDGLGKTYRIDSTITLRSNITIRNARFDFSNATGTDYLFSAQGTLGSSVSISAVNRSAGSVTPSDTTGIVSNSILYLESGDIFGYGQTANGEFVKVISVDLGVALLYGLIRDWYTTDPVCYHPTLIENLTFENLVLTGSGYTYDQYAFDLYLCKNVRFANIKSELFADRHVNLSRSLEVSFTGCSFSHSDYSTGLAYGIAIINGCERVSVSNCDFFDMRHGVTIGGGYGVNRHITVTGCNCVACTDAGLDCHPGGEFVVFNGNTIDSSGTESSQDGIVMQGGRCVCTNNVVRGFSRIGIFIQALTQNALNKDDHPVITGNLVTGPSAVGATGIFIQNQRVADNMRFACVGNTVDVTNKTETYGIWVAIHEDGSTIYGGTISGNVVYSRYTSLTIKTDAISLAFRGLAVTGNSFDCIDTATYACIQINSAQANDINLIIISGNYIYGGKYGINNYQGQYIKADANVIDGAGTSDTNGTIAGTNDNL